MPDSGIQASVASDEPLLTVPFVIVSVSVMAYFLGAGLNIPLLPRFVERQLGGSSLAVGSTLTAFSIASVFGRGLIGPFGVRYGRRALVLLGAAVSTVAMALQGGCHSLLPLLMLRAVVGFGEAALWVGAATWATDLASPGRRAEATSYQSAAVFVGLGLGPVVGNWLSTREDYTAGFVLSAVCMGISAVVVLAVHDDRADLQHVTNDSPPWWHALLHPAGLTTGVVLALAMVGYTAWAGFLALRADEVGTNPGTIFAVYSALVLCVRVLGARLPERIGLGRCAAAALSGITVGLVVMAAVDGVTGLWVGSILAAGGVSLMYPALTALSVNQVSDAERTAVVSTFTMFFEVGAGIGGLLCGAVASVSSYQGGFAVGAMAVVVGLAVLWFAVLLPRRRDPAVWDLTRPSGPPPVQ